MIFREELSTIVLSGGSTLYPGFLERFTKEMAAALPEEEFTVLRASEFSVWEGGSILAEPGAFPELFIRKEEYDEMGSGIIFKRFF